MTGAPDHEHKLPYQRLLIGFNHHVECRSVLEFAAQLAQIAEIELAGVFVEDQQLLDLARLPFTTEILRSSHQSRTLVSANIERDMRALADSLQKSLRLVAERARRQFSFRTVRGNLLRELIAQTGANDLILLRTACDPWWRPASAPAEINGPVVMLTPPPGANGDLAGLARQIAQAMHQQLVEVPAMTGAQAILALHPGVIIASAGMFAYDTSGAAIESFVDAAPCPVLIVPDTRPCILEIPGRQV